MKKKKKKFVNTCNKTKQVFYIKLFRGNVSIQTYFKIYRFLLSLQVIAILSFMLIAGLQLLWTTIS